MSDVNSHELLRRLAAGDDQAAREAFDRYVSRLIALVRTRISRKLARRLDADDIVQSAYHSFFVHAENGEYALTRAGDLWRLLASIALNKLHGQVERHAAARRSIDREEAGDSPAAEAAVAPEPTPAEVVALAEQLHVFHASLSPVEQRVLTTRLQGLSVEEIGAAIGKSPRTVRRTLAQLRERLQRRLVDDASPPSDDATWSEPGDASVAALPYADFTIERLVGAGGMGKVYRATQRSTGRTVALKTLLKRRQGDRAAVAKFLQEAEILGRLHHPSIVGVYGAGRFPGGGYFLAMEFADGADLQSRLADGPMAVADAVRVVADVAAAIGYAHDQGVVHGDLKPANVQVDERGRVVVTDFGLAQMAWGRSPRKAPAWIVGGTAGYIAPEVRELGRLPSPTSDVYGLGALLWALVTGSPPTAAALRDARGDPLDAVFARCLAWSPDERYQQVTALLADLPVILPCTPKPASARG